jgi:Ala-tRNA(Pro) deacylase
VNVESFLTNRNVPFDMLPHRTEYSASRTAQALHVPGANFAKTVVLDVDGRPVMAVLQATCSINLPNVQRELGAQDVHLMTEDRLKQLFPDCELGAVPPFGSQYNMETLVDDGLADDEHIVFDGNTHDRAVYMRYYDYANIEHPHVAHITN